MFVRLNCLLTFFHYLWVSLPNEALSQDGISTGYIGVYLSLEKANIPRNMGGRVEP